MLQRQKNIESWNGGINIPIVSLIENTDHYNSQLPPNE